MNLCFSVKIRWYSECLCFPVGVSFAILIFYFTEVNLGQENTNTHQGKALKRGGRKGLIESKERSSQSVNTVNDSRFSGRVA